MKRFFVICACMLSVLLSVSLCSCAEQESTSSEILTDEYGNTLDLSAPTQADQPSESDSSDSSSEVPSEEPSVPSEEPSVPSEEPSVPSEEPSVPSEEPSVPSEEPSAPSEEPSVPSEEPSVPSEEPSVPSEEPSAPSEEPSVPSEEPSAPSEEPSAPSDFPTTEAVYTDARFPSTILHVSVSASDADLKAGMLYDFSAGAVTVSDTVKLYDICPSVGGVRVYALVDDKPDLSQKAAVALAALSEAAYRETGMRLHVRTEKHMDSTYKGYADYQSKKSVKLGYYDGSLYHAFDVPGASKLAAFVRENAYKYGFVDLSTKDDVGHFRYVGLPHAAAMRDHGIETLSDYAAFLSNRADYLKVTIGEVDYYVRSFNIESAPITLSVPSDYVAAYELSATGYGTAILTLTSYQGGFANPLPYVASPDVDRSGTVICLDAGHGDHDPGAVWPQTSSPTYLEKEYNLAVALEAKAYLEAMGYTVVLTRDDDSFLSLDGRVSFAKSKGTDLFVSFHCNSTETPSSPGAIGPQIYFNQNDSTKYLNWTTAKTFRESINAATAGYIAKGEALPVDESDLRNGSTFAVLRDDSLPSVLLEMGFITNEGDRALFENAAWRESMGYAVAMAVEKLFANDYIGVK